MPVPWYQPPADRGKVTPPWRLRQYSPARQKGEPAANPLQAQVDRPAEVTQPPLPMPSMWYMRPSRPIPSPSMETPIAE